MSTSTADPEFKPYVPADENIKEFTLPALATGVFLGLIFAASSLYLVLKVGMTVSASIPVAVLAITLFRAFSRAFGLRQATILENNITQTAGSAGESIAFGVGVTMPALMLLGFGMDLARVMVVSVLGGILGILAMIPLRRAFIVKMHGRPGEPGTLLYPEGTACAQVLISGEKGGTTGKTVFFGFGLAFLHKFLTEGMALLIGTFKLPLTFINKAAVFSQEMASELLGVGYIIGLRTSAMMMGGAVLGYLVLIPLIYFIGEHAPKAISPGDKPISEMSVKNIRDNYLLFIGAGCVATAGIVSMLRTLPMIGRGLAASFKGIGSGNGGTQVVKRTDYDMSMKVVIFGSFALIGVLSLFLGREVDPIKAGLGALLVVVFGFLFVTVSARLTGEIGSSSNPISGMTVATLMLTCLIFVALNMTSVQERVLALSIAAVVCVASSNGGTTAQALKTGFLVGGTPKLAQYAILIGALVSALVIGGILIGFNESKVIYSQKPENIPDLTLTETELARLTQKETHEDIPYLIFDTRNEEITKEVSGYTPRPEVVAVREGRYLVNPASGKVEWFKDSTIMGKLDRRDDGSDVTREFDAPKTQVMGIIINGVLKRDLNWTMVAMGAMIALMLELCGVSALAFAVGLYVPIQYSTPIFVGGLIRWLIEKKNANQAAAALAAAGDDPEARAKAEIDAIRKSETSPGVLLASGYIAGGSMAGVLIAFLAFSNNTPDDLATYQYGTTPIGSVLPLDKAAEIVAGRQLGIDPQALEAKKDRTRREELLLKEFHKLSGEIAELNEDVPYRWVKVPQGTILKTTGIDPYTAEKDTTLGEIAKDIFHDPLTANQLANLNAVALKLKKIVNTKRVNALEKLFNEPVASGLNLTVNYCNKEIQSIPIPAGTEIVIPKRYEVPQEAYLSEIASTVLGRERKAKQLFDRNDTVLILPDTLPAEAQLKLPQSLWPAVLAFVGLVFILWLVGAGYLFRSEEE